INRSQTVGVNAPEFLEVQRDRFGMAVILTGALRQGSASELIGISVPDPAERFLFHWQAALKNAGVRGWRLARVEKKQKLILSEPAIAKIDSPTLAELVSETNLNSNNLYAEVLRQWILQRSKFTLDSFGVDQKHYRLADGSGLARANLASPVALVQVLQMMANEAAFRDSLPVAGRKGSLINRFRNSIALNRVQAKTGFLTGSVALSGYVTPKAHPPVAFSILLNHAIGNLSSQQGAIDEMVTLLADLDQQACRP
ncbi:MAG: D-alanyl-D-alanine carboxypeptidase, partial [Synechococcales bacterium]|nr:D-alanyl-D-alanine carboxypeptidase [Synechococcales bacterium]